LRSKAEVLSGQIDAYSKEKGVDMKQMTTRLKDQIKNLDNMQRGTEEASSEKVQSARSNIDGVEAEFEDARQSKGLKSMGSEKILKDGQKVDVDIEWDDGRQWTEVKDKEPFTKESDDWTDLERQVKNMLQAAKENPVNGQPPKVNVYFPKGATAEVAAELRKMGVTVKGDIITPLLICDPDGKFCVPAH
jgi:hypothetical protein